MRIKESLGTLTYLLAFSIAVFSQKLVNDTSFAPVLNGSVKFVEILGNGKILIAGDFTSVNGLARNKIARLNADGTLDVAFDANATIILADSPVIYSMEVMPDGKILLGGDLGAEQPEGYRKGVLRLNANGSFDSTLTSIPRVLGGTQFNPRLVRKAEQLPNGKILICGSFLLANGNQRPKFARYNSDGSYDAGFSTVIFDDSFNTDCRDVEGQPDGKYFVSGAYTTVNSISRVGLTRFNTDDAIDTTFNPATVAGSAVTYYGGLVLFSNGRMIVSQIPGNGVIRRGAQLDNSGNLVALYDDDATTTSSDHVNDVYGAAFQADGKAYITDGARAIFHRYYPDGSRDESQNRLTFFGGFDDGLFAVAVLPDRKVIVGGNFNSFVPDLGIDNTQINQKFLVRFTPQVIPVKPKYDFDGDGKDDMAVFRPSDRVWYLNRSMSGFFSTLFGLSTDKPVAADYDGDGRADIAVFRDGVWYWLRSSDSVFAYTVMGQAGDIPLAGKFVLTATIRGVIVFRPSVAKFYVEQPFASPVQVSMRNFTMLPTDKPFLADFNGDGKNDIGVFRDGNWFIDDSTSANSKHYQFGITGDIPVIGDFDGDLRTDYAVFRPSSGTWYIKKSTEGFFIVRWGLAEDLPVAADYDGDGKTDIAVYRPSDGNWYQYRSNGSVHIEHFGATGDIPAQLR